ncbi:MAG: winged helix DNA-binding domain-containing protein [Spirochaetales bacterium]|nr:winged helix DNA-binding domain-containing protein [Spirochaetales bacterium]
MITITKNEAARFLLQYHRLAPPRRLGSETDIVRFIKRVGCIQFDPLNVVAKNADLVLQSRCAGYSEGVLTRLLYESRLLLDGWDKNMSVWSVDDWPFFERKRRLFRERYRTREEQFAPVRRLIDDAIRRDGAVSSREIGATEKVDWSWAPTSIGRAVLESMYHTGELVVHHKEGTRKYYSRAADTLPRSVADATDPNATIEEYRVWYVRRRIRSVGLLWNRGTDAWLGTDAKKAERSRAIEALEERGEIERISIEGIDDAVYAPVDALTILNKRFPKRREASFIAPLDNLIWDRNLIRSIFAFDYKWEVYTPVAERRYGYYVLPILYGDAFIGRFEPVMNRKTGILTIKNWWWERERSVEPELIEALHRAVEAFAAFLGAGTVRLAGDLADSELRSLTEGL